MDRPLREKKIYLILGACLFMKVGKFVYESCLEGLYEFE
jgi:hypothetical protein